jgi:hypothetical protein
MKVTGAGGVSATTGARPARGGGGEGFRLPEAGGANGPAQAAAVSAAAGIMGVEALIALQEVGSPLERRRRSVARAGRILDVLESVKVALLGGELGPADLDRLRRAVREERSSTEDPRLEGLLDEIETRAEVELAKLEMATRAA